MRLRLYFLLLTSTLLLCGCPGSNGQREIKKLHENKNNLPDLVKQSYGGISFQLSSLFERDYNPNYTIKNYSYTRTIYNLGIYFSLETFNKRDSETIRFSFNDSISDIEAVHSFYIYKRTKSVDSPFISIRKELPKKNSPEGFIQIIEGARYEYGQPSSYFAATFKVDDVIYVMQLIGKTGNMDYIYDDFLKIINSVN